jgi:transposase
LCAALGIVPSVRHADYLGSWLTVLRADSRWFRQAHIKSESCYKIRLLLLQRRNLKRKFLDLENAIRHSLKVFGIRLGKVGRGSMEKAVRDAVAGDPMTAGLMDCMLRARAALWAEYLTLHKLVTQLAMRDELCRRFMAIPGVGPVTALSFSSAIDDPARFRRSRNVAAYFGLTAKRWQSGTSIDVKGRISKAGDPDVRRALYEAASAMLTRFKGRDTIKTWGLKLAKTKCHAKARVAVARKLAIVMHAMWRDGTCYVGDPDATEQETSSWNAAKVQRLSLANS